MELVQIIIVAFELSALMWILSLEKTIDKTSDNEVVNDGID